MYCLIFLQSYVAVCYSVFKDRLAFLFPLLVAAGMNSNESLLRCQALFFPFFPLHLLITAYCVFCEGGRFIYELPCCCQHRKQQKSFTLLFKIGFTTKDRPGTLSDRLSGKNKSILYTPTRQSWRRSSSGDENHTISMME